ncbi:MAG: response regulator [Planctomycetota bacterium]
MTRLLFVDDEQRVLAGLRRQLHGQRTAWEMEFAPGGEAALRLLASLPVDVLVTDMRMPVIDGGQLLAQVARAYPRTGRIVLSGQTDDERLGRQPANAQCFVDKPCPADLLESEIRRCLSVRAAIDALQWTQAQQLWAGPVGELETAPAAERESLCRRLLSAAPPAAATRAQRQFILAYVLPAWGLPGAVERGLLQDEAPLPERVPCPTRS